MNKGRMKGNDSPLEVSMWDHNLLEVTGAKGDHGLGYTNALTGYVVVRLFYLLY